MPLLFESEYTLADASPILSITTSNDSIGLLRFDDENYFMDNGLE